MDTDSDSDSLEFSLPEESMALYGIEQQRLLSESIKVKLLELKAKAEKEISDSPSAKHIQQRSIRLVKEAQQFLEDFNKLEKKCNMLINDKTVREFPQISRKIRDFKDMCFNFNVKFQQTLEEMLPWIGVGGQEEDELAEFLNKRHLSPFNSEVLKKWIRWKEREIYTVNFFTKMINTKIVPSQDHVEKERRCGLHVVCFVFTSLDASEPYLLALSHYLDRTNPDEPQDPHSDDVEKDQWFASKEITEEMRHKATLFRDFAEANKEKKNVRFLTLGLTNKTLKGCSIYLYNFLHWGTNKGLSYLILSYKRGFPVNENFEPPSKPEAVTVSDVNHNSVKLKVSPPRFGAENVHSYYVEYRVRGDDAWQLFSLSNPEEVTVSRLRLNTKYEFRCSAQTPELFGPHTVSGSVRTLPCCPPGKPHVEPNFNQISVSCEEPSELGPDVHVLSYVVEYAKTGNGLKEADLVWKQVTVGCRESVISGLQSETEYVVRVRCHCGVSGISKESVSVRVKTTKQKYHFHTYMRFHRLKKSFICPTGNCNRLVSDDDDDENPDQML